MTDDLRQLREDFKDHAVEDGRRFEEIQKTLATIDEKLDPIINVYRAVLLSKGFLGGFATIVVSITAIGAGVIWIINAVVNKH